MNDEAPRRRWEVSAPESGVLLWGPETRAGDALKLALLELVVRRMLRLMRVRERRLVLFSHEVNILAVGTGRDRARGRALEGVLEAGPRSHVYPDGTVGASVKQWARSIIARYQSQGGYVQAEVLPALEQRGLYRREQHRRLGLFETSRWVLTLEGSVALAELKALMESARVTFRGWLAPDRAQAQALFETMGAAVLLLPELFPEFRRLQPRQRESGTDDGGFVVIAGAGGGDERPHDSDRPQGDEGIDEFDANVFDFEALSGDFGPGPFDGLDAAADAIDDGVDSGGGDSGGDGDGE